MSEVEEAGKRLGEKMAEFVGTMLEHGVTQDAVLREVAREKFREEIQRALQVGLDMPMAWHLLATHTEEPQERLQTFLRVLQSLDSEFKDDPPLSTVRWWELCALRGDSLYETGRIHASAGRAQDARVHYEKALAQARGTGLFRDMLKDQLQVQPDHFEDRLEGKIAAALLLLDPPS